MRFFAGYQLFIGHEGIMDRSSGLTSTGIRDDHLEGPSFFAHKDSSL